jgi:hypothetical protein
MKRSCSRRILSLALLPMLAATGCARATDRLYDFDGDGRVDLALGAPYNNDPYVRAGRSYLFINPL